MQSVSRAGEAAVQARSEVRESYNLYRTSFDLARHYRDEVVPLRKRISEEMVLRFNGMLASVFELLADSREQVTAVNAYIETLREFWLADAELQMALVGGSPGASAMPIRTGAPAAAPGAGH
jgi:outer membrane protein TolC